MKKRKTKISKRVPSEQFLQQKKLEAIMMLKGKVKWQGDLRKMRRNRDIGVLDEDDLLAKIAKKRDASAKKEDFVDIDDW